MRRFKKLSLILGALSIFVLVIGYSSYRYYYPFGWSHCCDIALMFALNQYAEDHNGCYPAGEASPEASLSLLYPNYCSADLLRGKSVSFYETNTRLQNGEKLTPESCGWHYVEGLTLIDNPKIALVWDKVGLGHNGERSHDGGRTVLFVNMGYKYVPGSEWPAFIEEQERLLSELRKVKQGQKEKVN